MFIFFSNTNETSDKIDSMLRYKTNFNKFNRIETTQRIFSDHNRIEISERKKPGNPRIVEVKQCTSGWTMDQRRNHKGN